MKRMIVARGGKRGKTAGRGGKGQSARAGNKRRPEWRDIIKKLPKLRGRGVNQNKPVSDKPVVVNLAFLEGVFSSNDQVTPSTLVEKGVIATMSGRIPAVKILGDGDVTKAFKVSGCSVSESAKQKIEKAGGSVALTGAKVVKTEKRSAVKIDAVKADKPAKKEESAKKAQSKAKETKPKAQKAEAKV